MKLSRVVLALLACFSSTVFAQQSHVPAVNANAPWVQLAKLSSLDPRAYWNGNSVAISGNVIVVGAPYGELASVYIMPSGGWANMTEAATLSPSDKPPGSLFGTSVSIVGNTIAVGAPYATPNQSGAVYVFVEPTGGWKGKLTEAAKLTASDATRGSGTGMSVALNADTIVAGAPYQLNQAGGAYVFAKPASGWTSATQTARLTPSDSQANAQFGISVSISGNVIVAGSPYDTVGANQSQGAAYVYVEPSGGWRNSTQTAKLTASDGQQDDDLGISVSISGQTVAVGAYNVTVGANVGQGAAYVFVQPAAGWTNGTQIAKLTASNGYPGDALGNAVAIQGNFIAAGAPYFSHSSNRLASPFFNEGAAYVFVKPPTGWASENQSATLTGSDARLGARSGSSVAIGGNNVISGALFNNRNLGAAYVFSPFTAQ